MKKYSLYVVLAALVVFAGCSKKSSNPMVYTVNNLVDIRINQYTDTTIYLVPAITYVSGPQEALTVTPENLPTGVTVTPASISGTPTFGPIFTFQIHPATAGTFPVTINANSSSSGNKTFKFNLIVAPSSNCASYTTGSYTATDAPKITTSEAAYNATITSDSTNKLIIPTYNNEISLTGYLDCSTGTITTLPAHNLDFTIAAGAGTFTSTGVTVTYTITFTGGSPTTYTTTYTK